MCSIGISFPVQSLNAAAPWNNIMPRPVSYTHLESNQEYIVVKQTLCLDTAAVFHDIFENIKDLFLELIVTEFVL